MPQDQRVVESFAQVRDPGKMRRLFEEIFSPAERRDLALRWELMRLLDAGHSQREIAAKLGVSLCKITRGARVLKESDSVSREILKQAAGKDAKKEEAP